MFSMLYRNPAQDAFRFCARCSSGAPSVCPAEFQEPVAGSSDDLKFFTPGFPLALPLDGKCSLRRKRTLRSHEDGLSDFRECSAPSIPEEDNGHGQNP
jgi:hypothetical protein